MDSQRVRFLTSCISDTPPSYEEIGRLIYWSNVFGKEGYAPMLPDGGSAGNLSHVLFDENGNRYAMIITCSKVGLKDELTNEHFAKVPSDFRKEIKWFSGKPCGYIGRKVPSSETPLHEACYSWREELVEVCHGHFEPVLRHVKDLGLVETREERMIGSKELVEETLKVVYESDFIVLKNHGFLAFGKHDDEAGELARKICNEAKNLR